MSDEIKTLLRADWTEALLDFNLNEIDAAIADFTMERPDKCPNEGHIRQTIMRNRGRSMVGKPKLPDFERKREDFDSTAILREAGIGYVPKNFSDD